MSLKTKGAKVVSRVKVKRDVTTEKKGGASVRRLFSQHDDFLKSGREFTTNDSSRFGGCPRPGDPGSETYFTKL